MTHTEHKIFKYLIVAITILAAVPYVSYPVGIKFFAMNPEIWLAPLLSYNLIVIAFMSGTSWANIKVSHHMRERLKILFVALSIVITGVAWCAFYMASAYTQLIIYMALLAILLFIDMVLYRHQTLPKWYFEIRCLTTLVIFASMVASLKFV